MCIHGLNSCYSVGAGCCVLTAQAQTVVKLKFGGKCTLARNLKDGRRYVRKLDSRKKWFKNVRKKWDISCTVEDDMSENFFWDKNFHNWTTFFSRVQKILKLRPKCKFDGKLRPKMAPNFNFSVKFEKKLPETIQKGKVLKFTIFIGSGKFCSFYSAVEKVNAGSNRRSYLVPKHCVTTYCQLLLQFTLNLLQMEASFS